jgi:hypothetical protein
MNYPAACGGVSGTIGSFNSIAESGGEFNPIGQPFQGSNFEPPIT